jgi:transposase
MTTSSEVIRTATPSTCRCWITATGGIRAHIEAPADGPGYARMLDWARKHAPGRRVWALEGTGSFAAGLAGKLALAGADVVEVGALRRARGSKNDRLDAVRAGRTAMGRDHQSSPRVRVRVRVRGQAIRALAATHQGVLVSRTKAINELKSLIVAAPEQLRAPLRGRPLHIRPVRRCSPNPAWDRSWRPSC